jgi:Mn-dependent DtxR family transcriptional regulator
MENLSTTIQDHLSLIHVLERDREPIVIARLAERLNVTPLPSPTLSSR